MTQLDLLRQLKALVRERKLLECNGASVDQLSAHDTKIVRAHERLAHEVREAGVYLAAA